MGAENSKPDPKSNNKLLFLFNFHRRAIRRNEVKQEVN